MGEEEEDKRSDGGLRKPRREAVQIYRPGMFRRGVDATVAGEPSQGSLPPEAPKRPAKIQIQTSPLNSARSVGRLDQGSRRRSNDTESVKSYRGDSGSTTPDAASMCGERRNSWGRGGGVRTFTRGGGNSRPRNDDSMSECSVQSFVSTTSMRSDRLDYSNKPPYRGRNDSYNQPYNSTQSLFNARQPGGYLEQPPRFNQRPPRMDIGNRFVRNGAQNERASMRAETGHRRASGGRRRNDSINSTQSERPQPTQELSVDTGPETQSQAGDAPLSGASMDYLSLCKSFESIGSFDWTTEMEEHQRRMEEDQTKELQKRLEACSNGIEVQNAVSQNQGKIRGIIRLNIEDGPPPVVPQPQTLNNRENERPPPHPRRRRGDNRDNRRYNNRRGSDCSSSVAGSIFEEDESEENCVASGERTPTDSRPQSAQSYQKKRKPSRNREPKNSTSVRRTYTPQDNQQNVDRFERPVQQQRAEVFSSSRLAGRITRNGGSANRIDSVGVYQPPAMRRATDTVASTSNSKSNRDSGMAPKRAPQTRDAVYQEISQEEGPRLRKLNEVVAECLPRVSERKDVASAEKLLRLSSELCEIYYDLLVKDIAFTFSNNLEQHLWKQAFHKIIDAMKKGSNSVSTHAKSIRSLLVQLLDSGISFYALLLGQYEQNFDVIYESSLFWPGGLPMDDFCSLLPSEPPTVYERSTQKLALKSISRHLLSLGDLHRYKSLVEGNEDYSAARSWYLKAAALWPSSGHPHNQLAVVAYYSMLYTSTRRARHTPLEILSRQRQERVLDEIFYCVRAICAGHPYDAARDRLSARLAAMRRKVEKYETLLDSECGRVKSELVEIGIGQREHWVPLDSVKHSSEPSTSQVNPSQLHRRAVSYMIHTAGLIISKIGMEQFGSVSERGFSQLDTLLSLSDAPMTAQQLIQLSTIFMYAVHASAMKNSEADTYSVQQQISIQALVTLFGVLLKQLKPEEVKAVFLEGELPSKQMLRVLPAVSVICEWLSCSPAAALYRDLPSIDPLEFTELNIDTWTHLASLANTLVHLEDSSILATVNTEKTSTANILPELLYLSSFLAVFPTTVRRTNVVLPPGAKAEVAVQARLRSVLMAAEFLDGSQIKCIYFDEKAGEFRKKEVEEVELTHNASPEKEVEEPVNSAPLTREEILEREKKRQVLLIVKPQNLVPDTNALVDHLDLLIKIVDSEICQVLVPTIVIEELQGLSKAPLGEGAHAEKVAAEARRCVAWLREKAKKKCPKMNTLTTKGQKLPISIVNEDADDESRAGKVNDDRILQCCTSYAEKNHAAFTCDVSVPPEATIIYRNLVLLSEDRGLCIKATSRNIPTRTLAYFVKWANVST